jgi:hypothetical protein
MILTPGKGRISATTSHHDELWIEDSTGWSAADLVALCSCTLQPEKALAKVLASNEGCYAWLLLSYVWSL